MKIGQFTDSYLPDINGVVNHIHLLKKGLEQRGHEVHIFCPNHHGYQDKESNIHRFPTLGSTKILDKTLGVELGTRIALPAYSKYSKLISSFDILHTHHIFFVGRYAAHFAKKFNIPLIFTNHTNYEAFEDIIPLGESRKSIAKSLQKYTNKCTAIISPGEKMKISLSSRYGVKKKIFVVPNGIDLDNFTKPNEKLIKNLRQKLNIQSDDKILLFVGRITKEKRLFHLVNALEAILKYRNDTKLLIVGGGQQQGLLKQYIKSRSLLKKVILTGYVSRDQINAYYSLGKIFVTTSKSEVLPLTIIEAFSFGIPAVGIDTIGTGDIITNKSTGFLTKDKISDFRRAVITLIEQEGLRKKLGKKAKKEIKQFSIQNSTKLHEDIYKRYASRKKAL